MFNIGGAELLIIALVALVVVGPEQLPSVMRRAGQYASQVRQMSTGLRQEFMAGADQLDPSKWDDERGTGEADKPIVPRGYADRVAATDESNPFNPKPVNQPMGEPTAEEAAAEAAAAATKAEAEAREALRNARKMRDEANAKKKAIDEADEAQTDEEQNLISGGDGSNGSADSAEDAGVSESAE